MNTIVLTAHARTTTADFLKWERKAQDSFLQNSITMAGVIASQSKPEIAKCIDNWYLKDSETIEKRNGEIIEFMPRLKDYTPYAVVLAVLNDVCGEF